MKLPFEFSKIKKAGDPLQTDDIFDNKCWSVHNGGDAYNNNRYPITKEWLLNDTIQEHQILLKFQSWVKTEQGYYFEYRFFIHLTPYYNLIQNIE